MFRSNNDTVDEFIGVGFTGNVTPQIWFKTVVDKKGKPQLLAIAILSDVLYWYRPVEVRDERTGQLTGYRKKFAGDLLQRSYDDLEDQFGYNVPAIRTALRFLEDKNLVKRVFRTITVQGQKLNNVLFLELNAKEVMKVTFPENLPGKKKANAPSCKNLQEGVQDSVTPIVNCEAPLVQHLSTDIEKNSKTNTKITTKISTETSVETIPSICQESASSAIAEDGWKEVKSEPVIIDPNEVVSEETIRRTRSELAMNQGISYEVAFDVPKMKETIQILCYWNDHETICNGDSLLVEAYRQVVTSLVEMATSRQLCQYNGSTVSYKHVIDQINIIYRKDPGANGMLFFVGRTAEKVKSALLDKKLVHPDKYIKSLVWNDFRSYQIEWENHFHLTQDQGCSDIPK